MSGDNPFGDGFDDNPFSSTKETKEEKEKKEKDPNWVEDEKSPSWISDGKIDFGISSSDILSDEPILDKKDNKFLKSSDIDKKKIGIVIGGLVLAASFVGLIYSLFGSIDFNPGPMVVSHCNNLSSLDNTACCGPAVSKMNVNYSNDQIEIKGFPNAFEVKGKERKVKSDFKQYLNSNTKIFRKELERLGCSFQKPKEVSMVSLSQSGDKITTCSGHSSNRVIVKVQNALFPVAVADDELKVYGIGKPILSNFHVMERPQNGVYDCCSSYDSSGEKFCTVDKKNPPQNCIVHDAIGEPTIYCGQIREDLFKGETKDGMKIRPDDIALSYLYYRGLELAESRSDINLEHVSPTLCEEVGQRAFNWASIGEVVTSTTYRDFIKNPPIGITSNGDTRGVDAIKNIFSKPDKDKTICFVVEGLPSIHSSYSDDQGRGVAMLRGLLAMPVVVAYDKTMNKVSPQYINFKKQVKSNKTWEEWFPHSSLKYEQERAKKIVLSALKNPKSGKSLEDYNIEGVSRIEMMADVKGFATSPIIPDTNNFRLKSTGNVEIMEIGYSQKSDIEEMKKEYQRCESQNECCIFVTEINLASNRDINRLPAKDVNPSVISLYGSDKNVECAGALFSALKENPSSLDKIRARIRRELGYPNTGSGTDDFRAGGLLPKFLAKAPPPGDYFRKKNLSDCDNLTLAYPDSRRELMKGIANDIQEVFKEIGVENLRVKEMGETDLEKRNYTILLDSEIFYTINSRPSLFKYKLPDLLKGRPDKAFSSSSENDLCGKCLMIAYERELREGVLPPTYEQKECDRKGENKKWSDKCGVSLSDLKDIRKILVKLEERYQASSSPIFHLYYYAPLWIATDVEMANGKQCKDGIDDILSPHLSKIEE